MPGGELDHLVVVAGAREAGVAAMEHVLGVRLEPGGEHPRMGTHNALLRLGERQYLEVISVDPSAPTPGRPRWFGMDGLTTGVGPVLTTWVARTDDIRVAVSACPIALGDVAAMSRGPYEWQVTVTRDGSLPGGGLVPAMIEWRSGRHPATELPDRGCRLVRLEGFDPAWERLLPAIQALGLEGSIVRMPLPRGARPYLVAHIETPRGLVAFGGPPASA